MPNPMNFFNIRPPPSNHVGMVCYTRKTPFSRGGNRGRGKRARREPLPGVDSRPRARRIANRAGRGIDTKGRSHLHVVPPIRFLHGIYFFRRHRVWSAFSPVPGNLLDTLIGSTGKNFIVLKGVPSPDTSRRGTCSGGHSFPDPPNRPRMSPLTGDGHCEEQVVSGGHTCQGGTFLGLTREVGKECPPTAGRCVPCPPRCVRFPAQH
jgi:hypothetical protein